METLPKISILRRFVFLCLMSRRPVACVCVQIVLKGIFYGIRVILYFYFILIFLQGLKWIMLQCWLCSFRLNIALGSLQLIGLYFATTNLWWEARGHRLPSLGWIILESELLYSVSPLWCDTLKLQHWGSLQRDFWRLSSVYRCIFFFFFALQSVASGIKAETHTERQMSDLMTVITAKRESSMFLCIRRNKDEWVKYCWPREITVNRLCEVFLQFTWVDVINLKY